MASEGKEEGRPRERVRGGENWASPEPPWPKKTGKMLYRKKKTHAQGVNGAERETWGVREFEEDHGDSRVSSGRIQGSRTRDCAGRAFSPKKWTSKKTKDSN